MLRLPNHLRRSGQPSVGFGSRSPSSSTPLREPHREETPQNASDDQNIRRSSSDPVPQLVCDSECWLLQLTQRPLDSEFSQPHYLTDEMLLAVNSSKESIYQTLRPWQTRLITLQPGDPLSPLHCRLIEGDVIAGNGLGIPGTSEIVNFEALSYPWGNPAPVCLITCNGKPLAIAEELATALDHLRSSTANRYIWCDAICINQQDLIEKARQVKNMLLIFEKADRVVAWLGKACATSGRLFDALKLVDNKKYQTRAETHQGTCLIAIESAFSALSVHLSSAWFVRTWIRQEVFAAKEMVVQFGPYQLQFEIFLEKLYLLLEVHTHLCISSHQLSIPPTLEVYSDEYQHSGTDCHNFEKKGKTKGYVEFWLGVLNAGSLFKVSDERDRIFGALGLLTSRAVKFFVRLPADLDSITAGYPVDYGKSVSEVYQDVTKFLVNLTKTLDILDVFTDRSYLLTSNLPSWGRDYSREHMDIGIFRRREIERDRYLGPLAQDYKDVGKLQVLGIEVASRLVWLDAKKEISHPRDRFMPKYRRSITFQDLMKGPRRRGSGGLASGIDNPQYAIILTHVEECEEAFEMESIASKSDELSPDFANLLAGSSFVFAYVEDYPEEASFGLADLHLLVPRTTTLDDIVVSLYGSRCLHLLRKVPDKSLEYKYLGPIAGFACGQEYVSKYTSKSHLGLKRFPKSRFPTNQQVQKTFILV